MPLTYVEHKPVYLKSHPELNEAWLQERIADNPAILGLGEVEVLDRERSQGRAGRLDLLLSDPDSNTRFEVELMLGATDPSHVVRTIEYWDIERRRYPAYDHVAVLVAENVTARFLNVLGLFAGSIPLVAIQLNGLEVDGKIILNFVNVLDQRELRADDTEDSGGKIPVDRPYWEAKSSPEVLKMVDEVYEMIRESAPNQQLNYNRHFVGLTDGVRSRNFVVFRPRKAHLRIGVGVSNPDEWAERLEENALDVTRKRRRVLINASRKQLNHSRGLIQELVTQAASETLG